MRSSWEGIHAKPAMTELLRTGKDDKPNKVKFSKLLFSYYFEEKAEIFVVLLISMMDFVILNFYSLTWVGVYGGYKYFVITSNAVECISDLSLPFYFCVG